MRHKAARFAAMHHRDEVPDELWLVTGWESW